MSNNDEILIIWEAPKIDVPEFRLYYDDAGKVLCYTCEKIPGNYIVVDAMTFAAARPDIRVIDGRISTVSPEAIISKLIPSDHGQKCIKGDVSIVVSEDFNGDTSYWKLSTHEYKR